MLRVWDFMWYGKNIVASPCQSFSAPTNCKVGSKACVISNGKAVNAGDDFVLLQGIFNCLFHLFEIL